MISFCSPESFFGEREGLVYLWMNTDHHCESSCIVEKEMTPLQASPVEVGRRIFKSSSVNQVMAELPQQVGSVEKPAEGS